MKPHHRFELCHTYPTHSTAVRSFLVAGKKARILSSGLASNFPIFNLKHLSVSATTDVPGTECKLNPHALVESRHPLRVVETKSYPQDKDNARMRVEAAKRAQKNILEDGTAIEGELPTHPPLQFRPSNRASKNWPPLSLRKVAGKHLPPRWARSSVRTAVHHSQKGCPFDTKSAVSLVRSNL